MRRGNCESSGRPSAQRPSRTIRSTVEVANHAVMLIIATYRRVTTMDRMVREGRWAEGRPLLSQFPRLMGQTLGFVAFGHVARAGANRAAPFGVHMLAYDP